MPNCMLPTHAQGDLRRRLADVRYIFTDMDGTMLAPGSCALAASDGTPSLALVEVLVELKRAGIEVIPCSGRNRSMLHEDVRILGLNAYIGEMGGLLMLDHKSDNWQYYTADMAYDQACGMTPHEIIEGTGVCEQIIASWPGIVEYHNDMAEGYKHREVTVGMRGAPNDEDVRAILDHAGIPLEWGDNGFLNYISAPTTLAIPEGKAARAFNILPAGLTKGRGIARFCELRGIDPATTIGVGDAESDYTMAESVGTFLLVENGLKHEGAEDFLAATDNAYITRGRIVDGWVRAMKTVLEAQG
ncbi:HAD-IIB family hydrolase [Collinsella sp. AGMB00827]|uniref:HAD-IIB family hydrolase n=1 Tax=Collinsella ureilytica TaxID=2869515 RepID=A0ABS7MK75_9ACTN|nr:HAD-IIB family hydrolase [Collinsella urealyticum]MBY4797438.1 HAD-IIB family hydrolase [Collinsella urealyticum]